MVLQSLRTPGLQKSIPVYRNPVIYKFSAFHLPLGNTSCISILYLAVGLMGLVLTFAFGICVHLGRKATATEMDTDSPVCQTHALKEPCEGGVNTPRIRWLWFSSMVAPPGHRVTMRWGDHEVAAVDDLGAGKGTVVRLNAAGDRPIGVRVRSRVGIWPQWWLHISPRQTQLGCSHDGQCRLQSPYSGKPISTCAHFTIPHTLVSTG